MTWWPALLAISVAFASPPFTCFRPLAELGAQSPKAQTLIVDTYRKLWHHIGLPHVTPEELEQVVKANDPYLELDTTPPRLDDLKRRLKEFRQMLKQKEWDNPTTHSVLTEALQALFEPLARAGRELPATLGQNSFETWDVAIDGLQFSPDGKWALSPRAGPGRHTSAIVVLDINTRKNTEYAWSFHWYEGDLHFTSDGNWILSRSMSGPNLYQIPFTNGVLDVAKGAEITFANPGLISRFWRKEVNGRVWHVRETPDPSIIRVTVGDNRRSHDYLLDLRTKKATFARTNAKTNHSAITSGDIPGPGGKSYTIGYTDEGEYSLKTTTTKPDGTISEPQVFHTWHENGADGDAPTIRWSRDGKAVLCYHFDPPLTLVERGSAESISRSLLTGKLGARIKLAFFSNDGEKVGAVAGTWEGGNKLYWYDRRTKVWTVDQNDVTTPGPSWYRVSPDGKRLVFGVTGSPTKAMTINP